MKSRNKNKPYKSDYGYWRKVMTAFQKQDLPQREFCQQHHYDFRQFRYYRSRLSRIDRGIVVPKEKPSTAPPFATIQVVATPTMPVIPIHKNITSLISDAFIMELKSGIRCHIPVNFDTGNLRKLMSALQ